MTSTKKSEGWPWSRHQDLVDLFKSTNEEQNTSPTKPNNNSLMAKVRFAITYPFVLTLTIVTACSLLISDCFRAFTDPGTTFGFGRHLARRLWRHIGVQSLPSGTARFVAAYRYNANLDGNCDDSLARYFVNFEVIPFFWLLTKTNSFCRGGGSGAPSAWYFAARTRFMDRVVRAVAADQVVILAAGFDTRAYRNLSPTSTFFEVDAPTTQRAKRAIVDGNRNVFLRHDPKIKFVAVDFTQNESFLEKLRESGFEMKESKSTLVLVEGLLYYLNEADVRSTFTELAKLPTGTLIALESFEALWTEKTLAAAGGVATTEIQFARSSAAFVKQFAEPWLWGIEPEPGGRTPNRNAVQAFFEPFGFKVLFDIVGRDVHLNFPMEGVASERTYINSHFVLLEVVSLR